MRFWRNIKIGWKKTTLWQRALRSFANGENERSLCRLAAYERVFGSEVRVYLLAAAIHVNTPNGQAAFDNLQNAVHALYANKRYNFDERQHLLTYMAKLRDCFVPNGPADDLVIPVAKSFRDSKVRSALKNAFPLDWQSSPLHGVDFLPMPPDGRRDINILSAKTFRKKWEPPG